MVMFKEHVVQYEIYSGNTFSFLTCQIHFLHRWNQNVRTYHQVCADTAVFFFNRMATGVFTDEM